MHTHVITCPACEEGKVFTSRYGGNDPDTWFSHWCEECDGKGNILIEDEHALIAVGSIVTTKNRNWYLDLPVDPIERYRAAHKRWKAEANGLVGYGFYEDGAVIDLIAEAEEQREARELEAEAVH